jgi:hypothetical protein
LLLDKNLNLFLSLNFIFDQTSKNNDNSTEPTSLKTISDEFINLLNSKKENLQSEKINN